MINRIGQKQVGKNKVSSRLERLIHIVKTKEIFRVFLILLISYFFVCTISYSKMLQWLLPGRYYTPPSQSTNEMMKAMTFDEHGLSSVLKLTSFPKPIPQHDQVLIKVHAAGLNPIDVKLRKHPISSMILPKPKITGVDVSGTVISAPPESGFSEGQQVYAMMPMLFWQYGATAEYAAIPQSLVSPIPKNVSLMDAAVLPLASLTVHQGFTQVLDALSSPQALKGSKILVTAGSGGVGSIAIQYAKHVLEASEVATTCSDHNFDFVRSLGADIPIDYHKEKFEEIVKDYDVVFDTLAYEYMDRALDEKNGVIRRDGRGHYVHIGGSKVTLNPGEKGTDFLGLSVPEARADKLAGHYWRQAASAIFRSSSPQYHVVFVRPNGEHLKTISRYYEEGKIKPIVNKIFDMENISQAHDELEHGHSKGKNVIRIEH